MRPEVRLSTAERQQEAARFRCTALRIVAVKRYMTDGTRQFGFVFADEVERPIVTRTDDGPGSRSIEYSFGLHQMLEDGWMGD